jgi:hypothetical protein
METLEQFYEFMDELQTLRRVVAEYVANGLGAGKYRGSLENAAHAIDELPGDGLDKRLHAGGRPVTVRLDYERVELEKDILYLRDGEEGLVRWMAQQHDASAEVSFDEEVRRTSAFLKEIPVEVFLTDRDGTVNNYCGRYRSSHQSIYNAVYLTRFATFCTHQSVILTSAPLGGDGLLNLTAMPGGTVHYAGSKGREYHSKDGHTGRQPVSERQEAALKQLNERIEELLSSDRYRPLRYIGSGIQYKHGQTTVTRQDIHGSIPEADSQAFLTTIRDLLREVDPEETIFRIEDTGKDIEIMLTVDGEREYDKGDGVTYLTQELELGMDTHPSLICGDTGSDLPMVQQAATIGGDDRVATVFVTTDRSLKKRVESLGVRHLVVSTPDVLVTALNRYAAEEGPS